MTAIGPLHIGLLTPAYDGRTSVGSGIGVHFRTLAEGMVASGYRVTVLHPASAPTPIAPQDPRIEFITVNCKVPRILPLVGRLNWQLHQWLDERARLRALANAAARVPADVWETTGTGAPSLFLQTPAPLVLRVSTTAAQLRCENRGRRTWISRRHEAWETTVVRRADHVITHSPGHRAAIAAEFQLPISAITVIPHGVSMPADVPTRLIRNRVRVLFVGRLEHRKGADLVIAALRDALARHPDLEAVLVGRDHDDHWQLHWREIAPPGIVDRVQFAGQVDDATLADHYAAADIFLAPSRYESFGLMFAEAMAWGLPVVALRAPGAVDLIEDGRTGLLAPPEDAPALATALIALARNRPRAIALGAAGRERCARLYSIPALVRASVELYNATLSGVPNRK